MDYESPTGLQNFTPRAQRHPALPENRRDQGHRPWWTTRHHADLRTSSTSNPSPCSACRPNPPPAAGIPATRTAASPPSRGVSPMPTSGPRPKKSSANTPPISRTRSTCSSRKGGTANLLQIDPQDRGNFISGHTGFNGTKFGVQYDIPLAPLQTLASLNGANPGGSSGYLPRFAQPIGNSWAHPLISASKMVGDRHRRQLSSTIRSCSTSRSTTAFISPASPTRPGPSARARRPPPWPPTSPPASRSTTRA